MDLCGAGYLMGPAAAIWLKGSSDRFSLLDSQLRHTGGNGLGVQRSDAVEVSGTVFEDMGFSGMELQGEPQPPMLLLPKNSPSETR